MAPRIAIIIYSMYGHINELAKSIKGGIEDAGGQAEIFQVAETLPDDVLVKMHVKRDFSYPIATPTTLTEFDAFLFGIPTRYGNMPAQIKTFWDATGKLWVEGKLTGKYAGVFVSTGGLGGGQETTAITFMSTLVHHGFVFVPFGYATGFRELSSLDEVHGGSPWGAGTFGAPDGSRTTTARELEMGKRQGMAFYGIVSRVKWE
ncbi:hypothetical protein GALMADRAFT_241634 [Galerina marginata CBS 339.88]|uniref:Flavodoxin-like domain-containing protein n=1 Tax=Galerina marginata (strain CBS 339.88) TaxID=685588 RepID=A0A067TCU3_GALM3|nr:hypothetical protein GALMADRAFT_241634 [Galerina marginata CBS 339.88]